MRPDAEDPRWLAYVGQPDRDHVHLNQGGLTWDQAQALLREWVQLYLDDDRERQARDSAELLEVLEHPDMRGKPMSAEIAGETHAIFYDPRFITLHPVTPSPPAG